MSNQITLYEMEKISINSSLDIYSPGVLRCPSGGAHRFRAEAILSNNEGQYKIHDNTKNDSKES